MTHIYFDQDKIDWSAYVRGQQRGQGDDEQKIFRGMRYVRGYGNIRNVLGSVGRFLLPIATNIMESAKKEAVSSLGAIASDLSQGRAVGEAVKEHAKGAAERIGSRLEQCGKGQKINKNARKKEVPKIRGKSRKNERLSYLDFN
jgi:hypothetical protein